MLPPHLEKSKKQTRPRTTGPTGSCAHNIGAELADKQPKTRRWQRVDAAQSKYVPKFRPSANRQWPWSPPWEPNQPGQNEAVTTLNDQLKCYNTAVYRGNSICFVRHRTDPAQVFLACHYRFEESERDCTAEIPRIRPMWNVQRRSNRTLNNKPKSKSQKTPRKQDVQRTDARGTAITNVILLKLPHAEYSVIRPHLEFVKVESQQSLHEPGQRLEYGYFPNQGMVSVVIEISDGRTLEVGVVTKEGFAGESLALGQAPSPYRMICQPPGDGFRVKADVLHKLLLSTPYLQSRLSRYARFQSLRVSQIAACNRFHETEQRLARWLLMSQDRVGSELLPFTHEFLASMLGTGRAIVSIAAAILQKAGLIQYRRGTVRILDRGNLEDAACECYRVIKQFEAEIEPNVGKRLPITTS